MASLDVANDDFLIDEPYIERFLDEAENAGLDIGALVERADDRFVSANPKQSVTNYVVDKYGEYVLLKPQTNGANIILWIAPIVVLVLAIIFGTLAIRRKPELQTGLTDAEKARLDEILKS
nr:cytochrome c-type biogenesis protein CcmH [Marivivens niveibacter]